LQTGEGNTYADLCSKAAGSEECDPSVRGVTRFWGNDFDTYEASVTNDADLLEAVNMEFYPDGQQVAPASLFGNSVVYDSEGAVVSAVAMAQSYSVFKSSDFEEEPLAWQAQFQDLLEAEVNTTMFYDILINIFSVRYITGRSIEDALAESLSGEIFLFVCTYIIMIIFVTIIIGKCRGGSVRRRTWLGLGGVGLVVAAGLAGYGVNSGFGVPFTSLLQILPFILIGIGVDDMFVIVASLDHTDVNLPNEERIALAIKRCGVSVT
ncbi:unnamed protein product, partial [Sphacelaria rigidula]